MHTVVAIVLNKIILCDHDYLLSILISFVNYGLYFVIEKEADIIRFPVPKSGQL